MLTVGRGQPRPTDRIVPSTPTVKDSRPTDGCGHCDKATVPDSKPYLLDQFMKQETRVRDAAWVEPEPLWD